jgi:hypothetical protein
MMARIPGTPFHDFDPPPVKLTKEELLFLLDSLDRDFAALLDQERAEALIERLARGWYGQGISEIRRGP